jgi:hypothetical protein
MPKPRDKNPTFSLRTVDRSAPTRRAPVFPPVTGKLVDYLVKCDSSPEFIARVRRQAKADAKKSAPKG